MNYWEQIVKSEISRLCTNLTNLKGTNIVKGETKPTTAMKKKKTIKLEDLPEWANVHNNENHVEKYLNSHVKGKYI